MIAAPTFEADDNLNLSKSTTTCMALSLKVKIFLNSCEITFILSVSLKKSNCGFNSALLHKIFKSKLNHAKKCLQPATVQPEFHTYLPAIEHVLFLVLFLPATVLAPAKMYWY